MAIKHQNNVSLTLPASFTPSTLSLTIAMLLGLGMTTVHAQTSQKPAENSLPEVKVKSSKAAPSYNPPTSKSAAKIDAPIRDIPQTINVIPEQLMRDQGARSIQDVLKNVPGIGFHSGDGQRDQVTIRGFSALTDQFIDGLRDDALYYRSLYNVQELEVLKGPASVLYGRGSSGGIINRITKKPFFNQAYEISATVGSYQQKNFQFDFNQSFKNGINPDDGRSAIRILGEWEDSGGFRDHAFLKKANIAPSILWQPNRDTLVLLQYEHTEDRRLLDFGIPSLNGQPAPVAIGTWYGSNDPERNDYNKSVVDSVTATVDYKINADWSFKNAFRYYDYTLDRNQTVPQTLNLTNPANPLVVLRRSNVLRHDLGYFNQTELTQKAQLGSTQHQLLYGFEISAQNRDQYFVNQNPAATVSLFNPVAPTVTTTLTASDRNVQWAGRTDGYGNYDVKGLYVQDLMTLTPEWKALVGLRRDQFFQEYFDNAPSATSNPKRLPHIERTDNTWSPRAGLVWQPDTRHAYYASYSRSFQPSGGDIAISAGQEVFPPEVSRNLEIGAKFDYLDGQASLGIALFHLQRDNIKASFVPVGSPAGTVAQIFNIGQQTTKGIEVTFSGELGNGLNLTSGLAWMDPRISKSGATATSNITPALSAVSLEGKRPAIVPTSQASVWLTQSLDKLLGDPWSAGLGLNYMGSMYADAANRVKLDSYIVASAGFYYRTINKRTSGLDIGLNINNLFNKRYIATAQQDVSLMPGAPRNISLTVRYKF